MATTTVVIPPQIPADSSGHDSKSETITVGVSVVTHTYTIKKITKNGSSGSAIITNGVITSFTAPT